jgi:hypothetical protein
MSLRTLVLVAIVSAGNPARAGDREAAKKRVHDAQIAYNLHQFEDALKGFTEAYRLDPVPDLLFNIAQCHRQMRQFEKAAFFYHRYLALKPGASNTAQVTQLLAEVEAEVKKPPPEPVNTAPVAAPEPAPALEPPPPPVVAIAPNEAPATATPSVQATTQVHSGSSPAPWVGLAVGIAGLAAIAAGAYLGIQAENDASQVSTLFKSGGTWSRSNASLDSSGRTDGIAAPILLASGGAAVVAGGLLALFGRSSSGSPVSLSPTRGGAALAWSLRF